MKIYGHPYSTCTRKVLTTLEETGTPYELLVVDFATGDHKLPPHLARQPFGQVPALDDDGFAMYESRAICRYIDQKAGEKLVPVDPKQRGLVEQWISVETSNFTPHAMKFVYEHIFKRPQGQDVLDHATDRLHVALGVMEQQLGRTSYIAGDGFTLADICFMPYVGYVMMTPAKEIFAGYPSFVAWWERVSARPSWRKATSA